MGKMGKMGKMGGDTHTLSLSVSHTHTLSLTHTLSHLLVPTGDSSSTPRPLSEIRDNPDELVDALLAEAAGSMGTTRSL